MISYNDLSGFDIEIMQVIADNPGIRKEDLLSRKFMTEVPEARLMMLCERTDYIEVFGERLPQNAVRLNRYMLTQYGWDALSCWKVKEKERRRALFIKLVTGICCIIAFLVIILILIQ